MNGIHDMGGMHGFGPIEYEENEPVFHHAWEGRVFAMQLGVPVRASVRPVIEKMDPAYYLSSSYYEKWLQARIQTLIQAGAMTEAELEARIALLREQPDMAIPQRENPERVRQIHERTHNERSPKRDVNMTPQFSPGDRVRARNMHPPGHTRLPRYIRGKAGVIVTFYGVHALQDERPAGTEAELQPIYAVRFDARELWGDQAESNSAMYLDMWESYLGPA